MSVGYSSPTNRKKSVFDLLNLKAEEVHDAEALDTLDEQAEQVREELDAAQLNFDLNLLLRSRLTCSNHEEPFA